jgi:protein TonB
MRQLNSALITALLLAAAFALVLVPAPPKPLIVAHAKPEPAVTPPPPPRARRPVVTYGKALPEDPTLRVPIKIPPGLTAKEIFGYVHVRLIISKEGVPTNIEVIHYTVHPSLVKPLVDRVRDWRYQPTLIDGEPVEVQSEVDVGFHL